eukprot:COSAG01_NODE_1466_length_10220_cov_15.883608_11_plen_94_part_00
MLAQCVLNDETWGAQLQVVIYGRCARAVTFIRLPQGSIPCSCARGIHVNVVPHQLVPLPCATVDVTHTVVLYAMGTGKKRGDYHRYHYEGAHP